MHRNDVLIEEAGYIDTTVHESEPWKIEPRSLERFRVLLAEDNPVMRQAVASCLELLGCEVTAVADGEEALDAYGSNGQYQLVITDIDMPRRDGVSLCREIRSLRPGQELVVMSARLRREMENLLQSVPKVTLIEKPFAFEQCAALIRKMRAKGPEIDVY